MSELKMEDVLEQGKSSYYSCDLPTGIVADGVLHKRVEIREITGYEEDILANAKSSNIVNSFQKIMERCVMSIGDIKQTDPNWPIYIKNLTNADRIFLVIRIRAASLGHEYSYRIGCPHCGKLSNQTVDLRDFKIEGLKDPMKRTWEGVLPSGKTFKMSVATGDKDIPGVNPTKDSITYEIMLRLKEINGEEVRVATVKNLSMRDRIFLRGQIRDSEVEIDNEIEMACPSCGEEFKTTIDIAQPAFFFPSEI